MCLTNSGVESHYQVALEELCFAAIRSLLDETLILMEDQMSEMSTVYRFVAKFIWDAGAAKYRTGEEILQRMEDLLKLRDYQIQNWGFAQVEADWGTIKDFLARHDAKTIANEIAETKGGLLFTLIETATVGTFRRGYVYTEEGWRRLSELYDNVDPVAVKKVIHFSFRWPVERSVAIYRELFSLPERHLVYINDSMPIHHFKIRTSDYTVLLADAEGQLVGVLDTVPNLNGDAVHFTSADEEMINTWVAAGMPQYLKEFGQPNSERYYRSYPVNVVK